MNNSCVNFNNVANARYRVRKNFGLSKRNTKKLSQQNVCNLMKNCSKNPKSLPPLRFAQASGKFFLIDKRSPLSAADFVKLFGNPTDDELKKIKEKLKIKNNSSNSKSKEAAKNEIITRLQKLEICEPIQVPLSCKLQARNRSENLGNGANLMNNNSTKPMNGNNNSNINNGPKPMNLNNNNNNINNGPKPMNGNNNGPKPNNGSGKKKAFFSKLFGKNNTPPPPVPVFGGLPAFNGSGNKLPLGGIPRTNGNGQSRVPVSMFGNRPGAPTNRNGALPRRPGASRNNENFLGKLENLKNNISNTKRNII
jgi:hypothetical protein